MEFTQYQIKQIKSYTIFRNEKYAKPPKTIMLSTKLMYMAKMTPGAWIYSNWTIMFQKTKKGCRYVLVILDFCGNLDAQAPRKIRNKIHMEKSLKNRIGNQIYSKLMMDKSLWTNNSLISLIKLNPEDVVAIHQTEQSLLKKWKDFERCSEEASF